MALKRTVDRYRALCENVINAHQGAALQPSQRLLVRWFKPLSEAIDEEQVCVCLFSHAWLCGVCLLCGGACRAACVCDCLPSAYVFMRWRVLGGGVFGIVYGCIRRNYSKVLLFFIMRHIRITMLTMPIMHYAYHYYYASCYKYY